MKFIKNNLKVIIAFIIGVILAGGIVYAATSAKEVTYTTEKNSEIKSVEDALNDLYLNKKSVALVKSSLSGDAIQTVSAKEIPNYQNLTEDNFFIKAKSMYYQEKVSSGYVSTRSIDISYDSTTGDIQIGKIMDYQWYSYGSTIFYLVYDVFCIY